jgi:ARG/rhodanese/phosphatase superfamily protein
MRLSLLAAISLSPVVLAGFAGFTAAPAADGTHISGPVTHENLAVYFIHGPSASGKVPLTLEEALKKRVVQVRETGNVNQLEIENLGNEEVFIQSGDIVKGGQQDRTLMVSLVLPPKSGRVPIASFCVEEGRWTARGREDVKQFATASASVPSRELKLAMKAPKPAAEPTQVDRQIFNQPANRVEGLRTQSYAVNETGVRQSEVWQGVRKLKDRLGGNLGSAISSAQSASSLQLALENEKLVDTQQAYIKALKAAGEAGNDIVGFVFAVNGKLNSADVYPSNGLFRKMWAKLLTASAIEAIGHKDEPREAAPSLDAVTAFLVDAERGKNSEKPLTAGVKLDTREGDQAYLFETARVAASPKASSDWVHRNYLAK